VGSAGFVPGHATEIADNDCVVFGSEVVDSLFENCNANILASGGNIIAHDNRFYTPNANASADCDCCGVRPIKDLPKGLEDRSTSSLLPSGDTIITWGRGKLFGGQ
jgi:hypothetical protein